MSAFDPKRKSNRSAELLLLTTSLGLAALRSHFTCRPNLWGAFHARWSSATTQGVISWLRPQGAPRQDEQCHDQYWRHRQMMLVQANEMVGNEPEDCVEERFGWQESLRGS